MVNKKLSVTESCAFLGMQINGIALIFICGMEQCFYGQKRECSKVFVLQNLELPDFCRRYLIMTVHGLYLTRTNVI